MCRSRAAGPYASVTRDAIVFLCGQGNDKHGKWTVKAHFADADDFEEGLARVTDCERTGYINPRGEMVIHFRFHQAENFHHGVAPVAQKSTGAEYQPEKWGLIDRTGAWVVTPEFDSPVSDNGMFRAQKQAGDSTSHLLLKPDGNVVCQWLVPLTHDILPTPIPQPPLRPPE